MYSLYQAYRSYEQRASRGEFTRPHRAGPGRPTMSAAYRLGAFFVRTGLKLQQRALVTLPPTSMALK